MNLPPQRRDPPDQQRLATHMPKSDLPALQATGPLNLNPDGSTINYRKSHTGPNAQHWTQADAEEMERLLTSGTILPMHFKDIPIDTVVTYVNPICSEKLNDDETLKLRTRVTIGGDRIDYPYEKSAVTANMEALKILINAMISENANWSTIDISDFYLGTPLPHPEHIRIQQALIPNAVIKFYSLERFLHRGALYCSVDKTHYGLPQAGALSQQRLFKHLAKNGYHQLRHTPSFFRNESGTVRFGLVVDDFAVLWTRQLDFDHLLSTLTKLYKIKVNYKGNKYLGMTIQINRKARHVTLTMPGYVDKLLRRVKPEDIKGAHTPAIYIPPNYKTNVTQRANGHKPTCVSKRAEILAKRHRHLVILLQSRRPDLVHSHS
jgi:hypothetical protein